MRSGNFEARRFEVQARKAQVIDIGAYRGRTFVSEQAVVRRFRAGASIQSISRQTKWNHDEIQRAIRAELGTDKRAA